MSELCLCLPQLIVYPYYCARVYDEAVPRLSAWQQRKAAASSINLIRKIDVLQFFLPSRCGLSAMFFLPLCLNYLFFYH